MRSATPSIQPIVAPTAPLTMTPTNTDTVPLSVGFELIAGSAPSEENKVELMSTTAAHLDLDIATIKNFIVVVTVSVDNLNPQHAYFSLHSHSKFDYATTCLDVSGNTKSAPSVPSPPVARGELHLDSQFRCYCIPGTN